MKKIFASFFFVLFAVYVQAQIVVNSAPTTSSICYNDGTLSMNVSGGTAPYTYSIISGPVLPNVTYPIAPDNGSSFVSLHSGTYTVRITDAAGNTLLYNITIGGNYQFPLLSAAIQVGTIVVTPSLGLPPYRFALSTVGANGPFGPYQTSNVFDSLCNGTYWARVLDSCGNFYTTAPVVLNQLPLTNFVGCFVQGGIDHVSVQVAPQYGNPPFTFYLVNGSYDSTNNTGLFSVPSAFSCPDTVYTFDFCGDTAKAIVDCHPLSPGIFCSSFTDSTASISASGGSLPYTYKLYINGTLIITQDSGQFHHIPYTDRDDDVIQIVVTDACGRTISNADSYLSLSATTDCPFDGKVYVSVSGAIGGGTVTCIDCVPVQSHSLAPPIIFTNMDTGTYIMRVLDGCGETRDVEIHVPDPLPINAVVAFTACNDVVVTATSANGEPITTGIEFTLYMGFDSITTDTTGIFSNLLPGSYSVVAHVDICPDATVNFFVPYFAGYCYTPYFDTLCQLKLVVQYGNGTNDLSERYSLVSGANVYHEAPPGAGNGIYFNVAPGSYTLISDSGCSISQNFSFNFELTETHKENCNDGGDIILRPLNSSFYTCNSPLIFRYTLENSDTILTISTDFFPEAVFENLPADTFIARVYFGDDIVPFANNTNLPNGNQHCVLDSMIIIINPHTNPFLISQNVTVCGATDRADIPFTISGGVAPYQITIAGFPGITTNFLTGLLPNIPIGSYTMIVNDSCGVSSSFSVSVVDSCVSCDTIFASFSVSDTSVCTGDTVFLQSVFSAAAFYQWTVNGVVFSNLPNPTLVVPTAGFDTIQCIISHFLCHDTFSVIIRAFESSVFNLGNDTLYCSAFTRTLSSGISSTLWSTGANGSSINVSSPGLYWAEVNGNCGLFRDTIIILQGTTPVLNLGNDTSLCSGSILLLNAFSVSATSYLWSTGANADNIFVALPGVYSVTVSAGGCRAIDDINVQFIDEQTFDLGPDKYLCDTFTLVLSSGILNTNWSTGVTDSSVTVSDTGTYRATVNGVCGVFVDSVKIFRATTPIVNLGNDTSLCVGDSLVLHAFTSNATYVWNDSSSKDSLMVSEDGIYSVTVTSLWCSKVDSIVIDLANIPDDLLIADSILCNGETIILTPAAGTNPVWQDGSQGSTFEVVDSGLYIVTVSSPCGEVRDSVKIGFQLCPSELHVPDAFTPNGDGTNDHFTVFASGLVEYEIRIYNRWGELVYNSSDLSDLNDLGKGWDGSYKGKMQTTATFVYTISAKGEDAKSFFEKGNLTLIR